MHILTLFPNIRFEDHSQVNEAMHFFRSYTSKVEQSKSKTKVYLFLLYNHSSSDAIISEEHLLDDNKL